MRLSAHLVRIRDDLLEKGGSIYAAPVDHLSPSVNE
jgi:hypothetical protein